VVGRIRLDGSVYASPIVIGGRAVVATENDTVYAIQKGRIVWHKHLGTPAARAQLPCGNIDPLGITGTPVYRGGLVYVAPEYTGATHDLVALRLSTGEVAWHRTLDLPGVSAQAMQQRGALTVAGGRVWVPFGGLFGDCGAYKGRLVGIPLDGKGKAVAYTVPTSREAGMWAPPGPSFDGKALYVAVGNGEATTAPSDRSDSILKLSTSAKLLQFFAPTNWGADNAADEDLGSQGPAIVGKWLYANGKSGIAYVLNRNALGAIGGQVSSMHLCTSFGGPAVYGSVVFVPCADGLRAVRIDQAGHLQVLWRATPTGSPVVGGARVWTLDPSAGRLYALDLTTGQVQNSVIVGATTRFATPAIYGRELFVPTLSGLTIVSLS
jgi:outer membrane protein assembly factor BamB